MDQEKPAELGKEVLEQVTGKQLYEKTVARFKPVFERVVADPAFRERLDKSPLAALKEIGVELDPQTRVELQGKSFSEFWSARRQIAEEPMQIHDLPPQHGALLDEQLDAVAGGLVMGKGPIPNFTSPMGKGPIPDFTTPR